MSKKAKRILALLNDRRNRDRVLDALNKGTLDEGASPVGNSDMKDLEEMNQLEDEHDRYMQDLKGGPRAV